MPHRHWSQFALITSAAVAIWALAAADGHAWELIWLPGAVAGAAWPMHGQKSLQRCLQRRRRDRDRCP